MSMLISIGLFSCPLSFSKCVFPFWGCLILHLDLLLIMCDVLLLGFSVVVSFVLFSIIGLWVLFPRTGRMFSFDFLFPICMFARSVLAIHDLNFGLLIMGIHFCTFSFPAPIINLHVRLFSVFTGAALISA